MYQILGCHSEMPSCKTPISLIANSYSGQAHPFECCTCIDILQPFPLAMYLQPLFASKKIFQSKLISKKTKLKFYFSVIRPVVTYTCETWILKETITNRLIVFERKILRKIFGPTYENGSWRIKTN